jgi:hypothetical protein
MKVLVACEYCVHFPQAEKELDAIRYKSFWDAAEIACKSMGRYLMPAQIVMLRSAIMQEADK